MCSGGFLGCPPSPAPAVLLGPALCLSASSVSEVRGDWACKHVVAPHMHIGTSHSYVDKHTCKHIHVCTYTEACPPQPCTQTQAPLRACRHIWPSSCLRKPRCPHACTHRALLQAPHAGGCAGRVDGLCHTQLSAAGLWAGIVAGMEAAWANPTLTSHSSTVGLQHG